MEEAGQRKAKRPAGADTPTGQRENQYIRISPHHYTDGRGKRQEFPIKRSVKKWRSIGICADACGNSG